MTSAPAVTLGRCNPYGAETGGPKRILGGLYGPRSAETPGMGLPQSVEQGEWPCKQAAEIRCRMECRCGHTGQIMALCSWHDEIAYRGEVVAGVVKRVSYPVRVRGHYEEISRRQSGSCPRCLFPGPLAAAQKEAEALARDLAIEYARNGGSLRTPRAQSIVQRTEAIGARFDQARAAPCPWCSTLKYVADKSPCSEHRAVDLATAVHNCPLTLVPVS